VYLGQQKRLTFSLSTTSANQNSTIPVKGVGLLIEHGKRSLNGHRTGRSRKNVSLNWRVNACRFRIIGWIQKSCFVPRTVISFVKIPQKSKNKRKTNLNRNVSYTCRGNSISENKRFLRAWLIQGLEHAWVEFEGSWYLWLLITIKLIKAVWNPFNKERSSSPWCCSIFSLFPIV